MGRRVPLSKTSGSLTRLMGQTLSAVGGDGGPFTFSTTSTDLDGLTLSPTGLLSGDPTAPGWFSIQVTAADNEGSTGTLTYNLFVRPHHR